MTGAELLALARHNRGAGETDADTAQHLAAALAMLVPGLAPQYCAAVCGTLRQLVHEDMIRRGVRNDTHTMREVDQIIARLDHDIPEAQKSMDALLARTNS